MATKKNTKNIKKTRSVRAKALTVSPRKKVKAVKPAAKPAKKPITAAAKKSARKPSPAPAKKAAGGKRQKAGTPREKAIQEIRMRLVQQKETLLSEAEAALNELPGQTIFPDLGDQATAETDRNFMLRLRGREQRLLKKIDEAISRIDSGLFGICDDCGNEIELKRLEARPVTTMCIECKTLQEEEEKLREQ